MPRATGFLPVLKMLVAAFFIFVGIEIALPIVGGIPDYGSLEVVSGTLEDKKPCTKGRKSPSLLPVLISTSTGARELMVPCAEAIEALQLGVAVEIRARNATSLFASAHRPEVWSISAQGTELYRYTDRVVIQKKLMVADALLLVLLGFGAYLGFKRLSEEESNVT